MGDRQARTGRGAVGPERPVVAIARHDDEGQAIREALGHIPDGILALRGKTVVLVPNWVKARPPETGAVVGPGSLRVLVEELQRMGPSRLVVAAGSGGDPTPKVFKAVGYDKVLARHRGGVRGPQSRGRPARPATRPGRGSFQPIRLRDTHSSRPGGILPVHLSQGG
ncbi:MAG: hypothetical protein C4551_08215 [Bacillota bacterium]|nr:MAG: hypothetical protein C4551_08215 [Bacillota bacterium]